MASTDYTKNSKTYTYTVNGVTYTLDFSGVGEGYKVDNFGRQGQKKHVAAAVELMLSLGKVPTKEQYINYLNKLDIKNGRNAYHVVEQDLYTFLAKNNVDVDSTGKITTTAASGSPEWNYNVTGTGANWNLTRAEKDTLLAAIKANGGPLSDEQLLELNLINKDGNKIGSERFKNLQTAQTTLIDNNDSALGFDSDGAPSAATGDLEGAEDIYTGPFNAYYENDFNVAGPYAEGNSGQALYDNLAGVYMNQANTQGAVANAQYQQQAMQQAAVVKQITDQVRGERMARLKAGMSESQIANQDMQMMMTNVDTLNQNAMMLNQGRLEAQGNMTTAKDQAYMDYLGQSTARGQVSTGQYAADAGNAYWQTIQQMRDRFGPDATKWTQQQWKEVNEPVIQGYGTNNE